MSDHGWGPRYEKLAARAKLLGWNGCGSFWGLCSFVSLDDQLGLACAGPNARRETDTVLAEIDKRLSIVEYARRAQIVPVSSLLIRRSWIASKVRLFRAWLAYHIQPKG